MLSRLRASLDSDGVFDFKQISEMSPRDNRGKKSLPYSALSPANAAAYCCDAAETVYHNIVISCSLAESGFYEYDMRSCLNSIDSLATDGRMLSALALSALVHISKCSDRSMVKEFISIATKATKDTLYRKAFDEECPSDDVLAQAKKLISTSPLADSLLRGFDILTVEDINNIAVEYVHFKEKGLRGWCAPGTVVLNVFALKHSLCLSRVEPLAVILGHESRHVLERRFENDMNFSTPDEADTSLPPKNRESGLGFELLAIGDKYSFDLDPDDGLESEEAVFLDDLVVAIRLGLASNLVPALNRKQLLRFRQRRAPWNHEMAFEYELEPGAYYFTE
jgi:hypothetical protein